MSFACDRKSPEPDALTRRAISALKDGKPLDSSVKVGALKDANAKRDILEKEGEYKPVILPKLFNPGENACSLSDPGTVTLHKLNRREFINSVHDLFGDVEVKPNDLPEDHVGGGFDNNAAALSVSPGAVTAYKDVAAGIAKNVTSGGGKGKNDVMACAPGKAQAECFSEALGRLATKAYRRPVQAGEVSRLTNLAVQELAQMGETPASAFELAVQAILLSPQFLYRLEFDSEPNNDKAVHRLDDFELASRLSYFLWAAPPDDELLSLAKGQTLHSESVLDAQVDRMVASEKFRGFTDSFANQWLRANEADQLMVDSAKYPTFTKSVQANLSKETKMFFAALISEGKTTNDLLDADFTFLNADLAKFYGINGVSGSDFQRVKLTPGIPEHDRRRGILGKSSYLAASSRSTGTNPIRRGVYALSDLLCEE